MIVIYFWYMVCGNVYVYLNGLNLICSLLMPGPGCRAAAVTTTEDAYAYDEERTELETFSPEVTDPVTGVFRKRTGRPVHKVGVDEGIDKVDNLDAEMYANSNDLRTLDAANSTLASQQVNQTFEPSTVLTDSTTSVGDSVPKTETTSRQTNDTFEPEKIVETTTTTDHSTPKAETTSLQLNHTFDASTNITELTMTTPATSTIVVPAPETSTSRLYASESTTQPSVNDTAIELTTASSTTSTCPESSESKALLEEDLSLQSEVTVPEMATEPMATPSESAEVTKDSKEQFYDELAAETAAPQTTREPKYEEGYYDPNLAPTRYGQSEEAIATKQWEFVSDRGIGLRDYNLILYAVNNTAVLEKGSLLNYVYFVFKEILNVNMTLTDIRYCRFLRSRNPDSNKNKVPPVLVAFARMEVKNEILHKRKLLKPTNIKVEHDMPKKILDEQNAMLKPLMDKYRAMGQYVVVRSGKLLVEGKVLTQIYLPDKYTYDPTQKFESYVHTTVKTTTPGVEVPKGYMDFAFGEQRSGKKKKGAKGGGGKKKRKPMIRIALDEEIGHELSAEDVVLFTTKKFFW